MKKFYYDLCLGLNSQDTNTQEITVKEVEDELSKVFEKDEIGFSITPLLGGYLAIDKKFITEKSLRITLITSVSLEKIKEFALFLKKRYNQETILVEKKEIESEYE